MNPILRVTLECIRKASRKILNHYDRIDKIADIDAISNLSNEIIKEELSQKYSYLSFIYNEDIPMDKDRLCIINPLDSVSNFYHKIPFFSISVTFAYRNSNTGLYELENAIIYDLIHDNLFHAEKGHGAFINQRRMRISNTSNSHIVLLEANQNFLSDIMKIKFEANLLQLNSSSLACAMIANSQASACIFDQKKPAQIAAGILIMQESGAMIFSLDNDTFAWDQPREFIAGHARYVGWLKTQLVK